jgi:hypothetical protein
VASRGLPLWTWLAVGVGGLAVAAVGASVYAGAIDGYIASNPNFGSDFYHVPAPSVAQSLQAILGTSLVLTGCVVAAAASVVRLTSTRRRWLAVRGVAAGLFPFLLAALGLKGWFLLVVNTICGDCGPPSPPNPPWPAFSAGADVIGGAIVVGLGLFLLLVIVAIRRR